MTFAVAVWMQVRIYMKIGRLKPHAAVPNKYNTFKTIVFTDVFIGVFTDVFTDVIHVIHVIHLCIH